MKPPKTVVERAKANGSIGRASLLLSAAYLLNSEASNLVEEASDILRANGLMMGELKKLQNAFTKSAARYFADFAAMIGESGKEKEYFTDLEDFDGENLDTLTPLTKKRFETICKRIKELDKYATI